MQRVRRLGRARRARRPGTTSSGSTPGSTTAATSPLPAPPPPELRRDVRDVTPADLEGIDAVVHLAALSNDPLGEFDESLTYAINHEAARPARRARARRPASSASSSPRRAACTAPPARHGLVDETRTARAADGLRRVEGARRASRSRSWRRTTSRRSSCASPPPTASRRGCGSTSCSTTSSARRSPPGAVRLQSDGTAWRPLIHVEDMARACARRARGAARGRPRRGVQHRRHRGELPRAGPRADRRRRRPGLRGDVRRGCRRRPAELQGRLLEDRVGARRRSAASGTRGSGAESLAAAYRAAGDGRGAVHGRPLHAARAAADRCSPSGGSTTICAGASLAGARCRRDLHRDGACRRLRHRPRAPRGRPRLSSRARSARTSSPSTA